MSLALSWRRVPPWPMDHFHFLLGLVHSEIQPSCNGCCTWRRSRPPRAETRRTARHPHNGDVEGELPSGSGTGQHHAQREESVPHARESFSERRRTHTLRKRMHAAETGSYSAQAMRMRADSSDWRMAMCISGAVQTRKWMCAQRTAPRRAADVRPTQRAKRTQPFICDDINGSRSARLVLTSAISKWPMLTAQCSALSSLLDEADAPCASICLTLRLCGAR